jgi:hypothetical protein
MTFTLRLTRRHVLISVAVVSLALAGGAAFATIPGSEGTVRACYSNGGLLRVVDSGTGCRPGETPLAWNANRSSGLTGYQIVRTSTTYHAPFTKSFLLTGDAGCPTGKRVTGGGGLVQLFSETGFVDVGSVASSQFLPDRDVDGRSIFIHAEAPTIDGIASLVVNTYAICVDAP